MRGKNIGVEFRQLKLHQLRDIRWNHRQHPLHRRCCKFAGKPPPLHPATAEATHQPLVVP